jgi:hypothetical protein
MTESNPNPDQEGFAEASLGDAQSENPPADPEYLEDGEGTEEYGGDQDSEGTAAADEPGTPDQAEG